MINKKPRRTLQDVRTLSGRVDRAAVPYKAYMRLSCLEMEKFRRSLERESALNRIENINTRFQDIENEKAEILRSLGNANSTLTSNNKQTSTNSTEQSAQTKASLCQNGFKFKY
ncbi:MAG: hypothetical protein FD167_5991 [bacterium]|nr:MAG: hypothetical protein FD167_5991 [bacterium]